MYSRNQSLSDSGITVPEKYDGTAFLESKPQEQKKESQERNIRVVGTPSADVKMSPSSFGTADEVTEAVNTSAPTKKAEESALTGIFGKLPPLGSLFRAGGSGLLDSLPVKLPKIGAEEILIIGIALFLLFSKEGDKECAIMLLLLIFIGN